jgi:hypothetical protein
VTDYPNSREADVNDLCRRFSVINTGAISDVLDEMGYRNQVLPAEIQGLTLDQRIAGIALPVEGEATDSQEPEEIFVPVLKMLGDLQASDVIVCQPNADDSAHIGELSAECAQLRGAVIDGGARPGKAPYYRETFIDEGDVDMLRVLRILKRNGFDGVIIPEHTPQLDCKAPWHVGMAYALGYIRALLQQLDRGA